MVQDRLVLRRSLVAVLTLVTLSAARPILADEPVPPPPLPPPPPVVPAEPATTPPPPAAPALPEGVTRIDDERPVTFVLTGGNRVVARRIGEDPEFFWVEADGRMARIRKADIASVDFQASAGSPPPPTVPQRPIRDDEWVRVPREAPAPRGRGMVIWGSIMFGLGYTAAIAGSLSEDTADDGTGMLLLLPIAGPFLYAATGAERREAGPWVIDGLLQVGGVVLLYFGVTRMREGQPRQQRSRAPSLDVSFGPHGGFAQATWTL